MTEIRTIYSNHVDNLVKSLPMDDAHFITNLSSQKLLPGDTESKIKSFSTQSEKASYFLSHVIKPALDIDNNSGFYNLLSVMRKCDYPHVVKLSDKITREVDKLKSGTIRMYMYVHVYTYIHVYIIEMQQYIDISPYRDTLGSDTVSIHI